MKKRGAKIKHGRIAPPTMVALSLAPEVETHERNAINALTQTWAAPEHFNVLLDCYSLLILAAEHKRDQEAIRIAEFGDIVLKSIRERWMKTKKLGATGEEIKDLRLMVDYASDWWSRQSGTLYADAFAALDKLREHQRVAA